MIRPTFCLLFLLLPALGPAVRAQPSAQRTTQTVKQVDEFLKRFYYEQTPDQHPLTTDSIRALYPRRAYLLNLFDARDSRRTQPEYQRAVDAFAAELAESTAPPADRYEQVLAFTPFRVIFRGKSGTMTACWRRVHVDRAQGWQLVSLNAPFLTADSPETTPDPDSTTTVASDTARGLVQPITLPPNTHETSFLAFHTAVRQGQDLQVLLADSLGKTRVGRSFVRAVRRRELVVTETERVSLFIRAGSGWVVRVDEFPRDDDNSGWLISDLYGPLSPSQLPPGLSW